LQRATEEGLLSPLRDQMARLRLSLYADDVAIFVNPVKTDIDMVMQIVQRLSLHVGPIYLLGNYHELGLYNDD
jgi:hypothetical protein